jgi:hypothetical protein
MTGITVSILGTPEQYVYPIILDMQIALREHDLAPDEALALADELRAAAEAVIKHKQMLHRTHGRTAVYFNDGTVPEWECSCGADWPCAYASKVLD